MIKSMTGFGRGEYVNDVRKITVEIRAVNHRYCDIYVKMPRKYSFAEEKIKAVIKNRLSRGKIEVSVSVDNYGVSDSDVRLDMDLAAKYFNALNELSETFEIGEITGPSLSLLARMPDVITTAPAEEDEEEMLRCILDATGKAVEDICTMRETEGAKLVEDIAMRADIIAGIRSRIEERAPQLEKEYAAKFRARIEELLEGVYEVPEERVPITVRNTTDVYDEVLVATVEPSFEAARIVAKSDGILVGNSSGAALWGATELARRPEYEGKNIVIIFPDTGLRYLSTDLFKD